MPLSDNPKNFSEYSNKAMHSNCEASDRNRTEIIPKLTHQKKIDFKKAYFEMHESYFSVSPFLAQLVHDSFGENNNNYLIKYAQSKADEEDFYLNNVGKYRTNNPSVDGIKFPLSENIPKIGDKFFKIISEIKTGYFNDEHDFHTFLTCVDAFLRLTHLPFDGSGRTNEDFLVLLAQYHGFHLTFSLHGYRGLFDNIFIQKRDRIRLWLKTNVQSVMNGDFQKSAEKVLEILESKNYQEISFLEDYSSQTLQLFQKTKNNYYLTKTEELKQRAKKVLISMKEKN